MSANTSLAIRIAAIFDNKGLKQADKGVKSLQSSVKKLAGAAGIGLSTAAVINFGKQAAKAFMADEKAATQLAQSVKNLGLAFETPRIEEFISNLSRASGVADDVLRPSMQKLLQTTGSVAKSTELLTQALDISRGSGVDYQTVVSDLTAAYVGQTRGLRKYSLGLSVAELKTMKFTDVQEKLNKQFSGGNAAYLDTYAGKLQILGTAAGEAQETIGKGLIDALMILSGDTTVEELADTMQQLADNTALALQNLAKFGKGVQDTVGPIATVLEKFIIATQPIFDSIVFGDPLTWSKKKPNNATRMGGYPSSALGGTFVDPNEAARKAAEAAAAKRAKELAALQKKTLDTQKKSLALQKASKTLNLEAIGVEAALKGKISETDRLSLELQKAILEGNSILATQLSDQLAAAIKRNNELRQSLLTTPEAPNPFRNWKVPEMGPLGGLAAGVIAGVDPNKVYPQPTPVAPEEPPSFNVPKYAADSLTQYGPLGGLAAGVIAGVNPAPVNVTVTIDGKELTSIITETQVNDSLSGTFASTNRFASKGAIAV
jgi:hypothetical protein